VQRVFDPRDLANPGKVLPVHACRARSAGGRPPARGVA